MLLQNQNHDFLTYHRRWPGIALCDYQENAVVVLRPRG